MDMEYLITGRRHQQPTREEQRRKLLKEICRREKDLIMLESIMSLVAMFNYILQSVLIVTTYTMRQSVSGACSWVPIWASAVAAVSNLLLVALLDIFLFISMTEQAQRIQALFNLDKCSSPRPSTKWELFEKGFNTVGN